MTSCAQAPLETPVAHPPKKWMPRKVEQPMIESPECFRCGSVLVGASTPRGGTARNKPFPDHSTGYCAICHIGLTKIDGLWAATPAALSP